MPAVNQSALIHYCRPYGMKQILLHKWQMKQINGGRGGGVWKQKSTFSHLIPAFAQMKLSCFALISLHFLRSQGRILIVLFSFLHSLLKHLLLATAGARALSSVNQHCCCEAAPAEATFRRKLVCIFFVCLCWGGGGGQAVPWGGGTTEHHVPGVWSKGKSNSSSSLPGPPAC